ncbi:MucBP domain-containing protein [Levilactobacillus tongjiangensis]|uniref:MucBP domain-containing protein n=1 Tax=Levilactobacillus tongjiangensis TaxID=2486023 RepID=A0ABW1SQG1_9LACO|nr:MucBP domain-containing protein [Levilactobacillus tongjiangensis]
MNDTPTTWTLTKQGRSWVWATVVTAGLAVAVTGGQTAQADTTAGTNAETAATTTPLQHVQADSVTLNPATAEQPAETIEEEPGATDSVENESADTNEVLVAEPTETPTDQKDAQPAATPEKPTTEPETAVPISAEATAPTTVKQGADPTIKAVKLVKAQVAQAAPVKLNHQAKVLAIDEWMPNQILQQAILTALRSQNPSQSWGSVADITQEDLLLLTTLSIQGKVNTYIDGKTEFSLEGLQYATNLTRLSLGSSLDQNPGYYYGDVVDLTPLAKLNKLTYLDLQHNRIEDVTPLAGLTNVKTLLMAFNHVQDFSPLKGNRYTTFHAGSQFVKLNPVNVDTDLREGHLKISFTTIDGNVVQIAATAIVGEPVSFANNGLYYRIYNTGGTATSDGQGGLYFTKIPDQKPGGTTYPGVNVIPMEEYYFMTGNASGNDSYGTYQFAVVQPYVIADKAAAVTVHYQDEAGKDLADAVTLPAGMVGDDYVTEAQTIKGYTLLKTPENAVGKYGDTAIDVYYVYQKDGGGTVTPPVVTPVADTTVTVHYQLANGQSVAADKVLTGQPGTTYTTEALEIEGYHLVSTPANASGTFGEEDLNVTYIYAAVETGGDGDEGTTDPDVDDPDVDLPGPEEPGKPSTPGGSGTTTGGQGATVTTKPLAATGPTGATAATTTLPQTNDQSTSPWWGVALLLSLGGWLGFRRRTK